LYCPSNNAQAKQGESAEEAKVPPEANLEFPTKVKKVVDYLVNSEPNNPFSEKIFRGFVRLLHQHTDRRQACQVVIGVLNDLQVVFHVTTQALKFLGFAFKLFLYCPWLLDEKQECTLFKRLFENWKGVFEKRIVNQSDEFRCMFFSKLISHLASNMDFKIGMHKEFSEYIDMGFNVKGIVEGSDFTNKNGLEHNSVQHKSPLQVSFIKKLNMELKHLTVLNKKLLEKPDHLLPIRQQLALILMEE